jgi:hypothetical protein
VRLLRTKTDHRVPVLYHGGAKREASHVLQTLDPPKLLPTGLQKRAMLAQRSSASARQKAKQAAQAVNDETTGRFQVVGSPNKSFSDICRGQCRSIGETGFGSRNPKDCGTTGQSGGGNHPGARSATSWGPAESRSTERRSQKSYAVGLEISCPGGAHHWAPEIPSTIKGSRRNPKQL